MSTKCTSKRASARGSSPTVSYAPIANLLAVAASLGVSVYDGETLTEVRSIDTGGWTYSVAISPDGHTLAASTIDGVRLWSVDDGSVLRPLIDETGTPTDWAGRMAFSPDGKILATIVPGGRSVDLWQVRDGRLLRRLLGIVEEYGSSDSTSLVFSPDGQTVAVMAGNDD